MNLKKLVNSALKVIFCFAIVQVSWSQGRGGRVLENIDIRSGDEVIEIIVALNIPMRYSTHVLSASGDELYIQMQPIALGVGVTPLPSIRESLGWKPSKTIPLKRVTYNGSNPVAPSLEVRFSHPVSVKVRSGSDLRSIIITLPSVSGKKIKDPGTMISDEKKPSRGVVDAVLRRKNQDLGGRYVVNLGISATQKDLATVKIPEDLEKYIIYQVRIFKEQKTWYRIRLGFFSSFTQAKKISDTLLKQYPEAWTTSVTTDEKQQALKLTGSEQILRAPDQQVTYQPVASAEKIEAEFNEAKSSLVDKEYSHAIALFTKILRYPPHKYTQESLELLGLAREKNGQLAHARAEYEEYLRLYGGTADAERVDQRLKGILTADTTRPVDETKTKVSAKPASKKKWSTHGTLSQFFRHDTLQIEDEDTEPTTTSLLNDINLSSRRRDEKANDRIQVSASYEYDILNEGEKSVSRVRELFYELNRRKSGVSMRLGRQNQSTGGVLGRFDGLNVGYQINPVIKLNAVMGSPVLSTRDGLVENDRWFVGFNTDLGTFFNSVDLNLHYLTQVADGISDRESVGGELRYFDSTKSLFALLDYDILYDELNVFLLSGNMRFKDNSSLYFNIDNRRSPLLSTFNALQGQGLVADSLDDLRGIYNEKEIRRFALDRSLGTETYSVGGTKTLSKKLQLTADVTMSSQDGAPTSAGVEAIDPTGNQFFYTLQFIGSELFMQGAIDIIGFNVSDTSVNDRIAFNINSRYRLKRRWLLNPRLDISKQKNKFDSGDQLKSTFLFRVEKRFRRSFTLEGELGLEFISRNLADGFSDSSRGTFLYLGYRWDF